MENLKELLINRNYKRVEHLHPVMGLCVFICLVLIALLVAHFAGETYKVQLESGDTSVIGLFVQLPLLLLAVVFILATKMKWRDLKIKALCWLDIGLAFTLALFSFIVAFIIAMIIAGLMMLISPESLDWNVEQVEVMEKFLQPGFLAIVKSLIFLALFPAILEELIYRGLIMEAFMKWGPFWAIVSSALLFGISHEVPIRIPSLIFVGLILGWVKYRTGNLAVSMLMHFIYNSIVIWLGMLAQNLVPTA